MEWIDSHCHLHHETVPADAVAGMVARAREAGVGAMLTVGTTLASFPAVQALVEAYPGVVVGSAGIHPCEVESTLAQVDMGTLEARLRAALDSTPGMVALGETGLDFFRNTVPAAMQRACFDLHLRLGAELDMPVIVHTREAEAETLEALLPWAGRVRVVLHCFTGSEAMARAAVEAGFFVSCSGIVTFSRSEALQKVMQQIPPDQLLVETDAPWLAPVPFRGKPNEPAWVTATGEALARLRGCSPEELARQTTANFGRFLGSRWPVSDMPV